MEKQVPSWDDSIDDYIDWSNASPQPDPTASLQKQGLYSEYTMSLSLCKKSILAERTGREVSTAVKTPWVTVKKNALVRGAPQYLSIFNIAPIQYFSSDTI